MEFTSVEISCSASLLRASTFQIYFPTSVWRKGGEAMAKGYAHNAVRASPWRSPKLFDKPRPCDASLGRKAILDQSANPQVGDTGWLNL